MVFVGSVPEWFGPSMLVFTKALQKLCFLENTTQVMHGLPREVSLGDPG